MKFAHAMPFGAELQADGRTRFRLWAPECARVGLELEAARPGPATPRRLELQREENGWHSLVADAPAGTRYRYRVDEALAVPDPASRANPQDVHGPSEVVDPRVYDWMHGNWRGRPWHEAVIYELHVGTFTAEGTFAAARDRLDDLLSLGVTAVQLMPVAEFPGAHNWGYDGVLHFAPDRAYGTPEDLKALVDYAHGLGLMVLLDVVYNHFGPDGNFLHAYCPSFFNPAHHTPWGAAINFDGPDNAMVRDFYMHNALYWIEEYRFDGLRLDAVHAIRDDSPEHIVETIARALREGPGRTRQVHLILENDANQSRFLPRQPDGVPRHASAQWNDDLHHVLHVLATGETDGYYADYAERPLERLGRALAQGFVYQGDASAFRKGELRGEPSAHLPSGAFVCFDQTHDQVGNRAFGERLHALADPALDRAALGCVLLAPSIPMLFMGEEWAASTPFLFFCDFNAELAQAVTNGRRAEFSHFAAFSSPQARERIPDPGASATFEASRLNWSEREREPYAARLAWTRLLLAARHRYLVPHLAAQREGGTASVLDRVVHVTWPLGPQHREHLLVNMTPEAATINALPGGETVLVDGVTQVANRWRFASGALYCCLEHIDD